MKYTRINVPLRSEAWLTEAIFRERAPSKWLEWVILGETHYQGSEEGDWYGEGHCGMIRIALRLVSSEIQSRFKWASEQNPCRNLLIMSIKLELQN